MPPAECVAGAVPCSQPGDYWAKQLVWWLHWQLSIVDETKAIAHGRGAEEIDKLTSALAQSAAISGCDADTNMVNG
jgi:hypothetical protein